MCQDCNDSIDTYRDELDAKIRKLIKDDMPKNVNEANNYCVAAVMTLLDIGKGLGLHMGFPPAMIVTDFIAETMYSVTGSRPSAAVLRKAAEAMVKVIEQERPEPKVNCTGEGLA